jgi:hypothetical protein
MFHAREQLRVVGKLPRMAETRSNSKCATTFLQRRLLGRSVLESRCPVLWCLLVQHEPCLVIITAAFSLSSPLSYTVHVGTLTEWLTKAFYDLRRSGLSTEMFRTPVVSNSISPCSARRRLRQTAFSRGVNECGRRETTLFFMQPECIHSRLTLLKMEPNELQSTTLGF